LRKRLASPVLVLLSGELGSGKNHVDQGHRCWLARRRPRMKFTSPNVYRCLHEYGTGGQCVFHGDFVPGGKLSTTSKRWEWKTFSPNPAIVILEMVGEIPP